MSINRFLNFVCVCVCHIYVSESSATDTLTMSYTLSCTSLTALTLSPSPSLSPSSLFLSMSLPLLALLLTPSLHPSLSCTYLVFRSFFLASGDNADTSGMDALTDTHTPPPHTHTCTHIALIHLWPGIYTDKQPRSSVAASHTQGSFV